MTVALEPPLTRSGPWRHDGVALLVGPRYVRTSGMSRWHRVRSGSRKSNGSVTWHLWCGQMANESNLKAGEILTAERPDDLPSCGTCEGRARGAGQDDWPGDGEIVFSPRRLSPPKHCPASRRDRFFVEVSPRVGRCLVFGSYESLRCMGGIYNGYWGIVQHQPADGLIPGCPFHAWAYLTIHNGRAVCQCSLNPPRELQ